MARDIRSNAVSVRRVYGAHLYGARYLYERAISINSWYPYGARCPYLAYGAQYPLTRGIRMRAVSVAPAMAEVPVHTVVPGGAVAYAGVGWRQHHPAPGGHPNR